MVLRKARASWADPPPPNDPARQDGYAWASTAAFVTAYSKEMMPVLYTL